MNGGEWGTVCDDEWDAQDANVVCQELGYPSADNALSEAFYGEGTGDILLDNVQCNGNENRLASCGHNAIGDHNCQHSEDAGVECTSRGKLYAYY